jgi:ribosomal-protein-alanine N-acetyltransferase
MTEEETSPITVRKATVYDASAMNTVNRRNLPENYTLMEWMGLITSSKHSFVALDNGGAVGYCLSVVLPYPTNDGYATHPPRGYVISIAVDEKYRGKGIGRRLLEESMKSMAKVNPTVVKLNVRVSNTAAVNLYKSVGFQEGIIAFGYYDDGEDAFEMCYVGDK